MPHHSAAISRLAPRFARSLAPEGAAAIYEDGLATDEAAEIWAEEGNEATYILGLPQPAQRHLLNQV